MTRGLRPTGAFLGAGSALVLLAVLFTPFALGLGASSASERADSAPVSVVEGESDLDFFAALARGASASSWEARLRPRVGAGLPLALGVAAFVAVALVVLVSLAAAADRVEAVLVSAVLALGSETFLTASALDCVVADFVRAMWSVARAIQVEINTLASHGDEGENVHEAGGGKGVVEVRSKVEDL